MTRAHAGNPGAELFTVLLEFGQVVVGVYLGIQVNDWNEARLERQQETAIPDRPA